MAFFGRYVEVHLLFPHADSLGGAAPCAAPGARPACSNFNHLAGVQTSSQAISQLLVAQQ
jgi:hypothetical protein